MAHLLTTAVLADIHANRWALEAVLEDLARHAVDQVVNLGDSLYGPLDPAGTFTLLQQHPMQHIAGNMDRYLLEVHPSFSGTPTIPLTNPTMRFVHTVLPAAAHPWLVGLPRVATAPGGLFLCHGTPLADDEPLLEHITAAGVQLKSTPELVALVEPVAQPTVLCAHTHVAHHVWLDATRTILNPGSVGLPAYQDAAPFPHRMESHSPHAKYCLVTTMDARVVQVAFRHVPYDWQQAARQAEELNRPDWAVALRTGRM